MLNDVEIDCAMVKNGKKDITGVFFDNEIADVLDAGVFLFDILKSNGNWQKKLSIFGLEGLFDSNIENDLTTFLKNFIFLKISKKQALILRKA